MMSGVLQDRAVPACAAELFDPLCAEYEPIFYMPEEA